MDVVLIIRVAPDIYTVHVDGDGAGKGAVKEKGVTIAKGLRIVCHHQGHNSSSRAKMMQIHLLKNENYANTSFENMYLRIA